MKLSISPTGQCFTEEHIVEFLSMLGVECVDPVLVVMSYKAGKFIPTVYVAERIENGVEGETYSLYVSDVENLLTELFDLPKRGMIQALEFEWKQGEIGILKVEHILSVVDAEFVTGFKATKIGD